MHSPFMRNRQRRLAAAAGTIAPATPAAPPAPDEATAAGQEYAALRVKLHDQLRQLSDVASHEARQPMKAEFAKDYADWIEGILEADAPVQDEILLTCMVWAIDYADFTEAVRLGQFALKHGLTMPERYNRSVACFLREDIAEAELAAPGVVDPALLATIDQLTTDADMADEAKAKLHKALGRSLAAKAAAFDPTADNATAGGDAALMEAALEHLKRALKLDQKVGVKKDIEVLERRQRERAAASEQGKPAETQTVAPQAKPAPVPQRATKRERRARKR